MKNCWPDGDLRAYMDGELTPESLELVSAHLTDCAACGARYRELSERSARVSKMLAALSEVEYVPVVPVRGVPGRDRKWAPALMALAAALTITFVLLPKRPTVRPAPMAKAIVPAVAVEIPAPATAPAPRRVVRHVAAPRPQMATEEFLRLDDDPIETGTLVRVSAEDGALVADLIVGPDGRAHAIRVVSNQ